MARSGRPAKPRGVLDFAEQLLLPSNLLLDTSFIAEALLSEQPHHGEAASFLARCAEHGTTLHFSRLLEVELLEVAFRAAIDDRHGKNRWRRLRHDGRIRGRAARLAADTMGAWHEVLLAFDHVVHDLTHVIDDVPDLMGTYGLSSYDAVHVASGSVSEPLEAVATLDVDFASLPADVDIYTTANRVGRMRRHRASGT